MDGDINRQSELSTTEITGKHQTAHPAAATVSQPSDSAGKFQISSDYFRKVDRTTDIAGRLPNAVYTLPPHIVQAILGLADVTDATREALVAECKKFFMASMQYEESKVVLVDGWGKYSTTIALDCGRLYAEGNNRHGQCGIGSEEPEVTGPRLIRLPPVLQVWCGVNCWFAKTTRGLYAWGMNSNMFTTGLLGIGDIEYVRQPRRVLIDSEVLDVYPASLQSFFRTSSGWLGCGYYTHGQLGMGHTDGNVITPTPIPGSEGVTRWVGDGYVSFAFTDGGLLACGFNIAGECGVGWIDETIATLTPVVLPDDIKGRVDRVVFNRGSSFFIAGRRCFGCGRNYDGRLGIVSNKSRIPTPIELHIPVDDIISFQEVTVIRSGGTLLACGNNDYRLISVDNTPKFTTPIPLDLPGPVMKVVVHDNIIFRGVSNIFVQLTDGSWVGRGRYVVNVFIPVPRADLIGGDSLPGWAPVNDDHAEKLNAQEAVFDMMFLPEPITNA